MLCMCLHILKLIFVFPPDDFESKFNFHSIEELPPPEEYRPFSKVYPSKTNKGTGTDIFTGLGGREHGENTHSSCFCLNI